MNNMEILANAFKFIEDNLQNDIKTKDVADACYCSKSVLEKIFRCIGNISVREYMVKRRMTLAAKMLVSQEEINMLDIASEMYDLFVQRKSCYFVCCDVKSLDPINKIAYKAGDLAILEAVFNGSVEFTRQCNKI